MPEPELAVVLNAAGAVAGYTVCNDMSSRSIEGQNPLYLPQAKIYLQAGDEVRIRIPGIGELVNPVVRGKAAVTRGAQNV